MAICCRGKKQKVSHSITSSIKNRRASEKHNGILDHQHSNIKNPSSPRHRSHSQINHHTPMPHDLTHSSTNSASSSLLHSHRTSQGSSNSNSMTNNHYYHKNSNKINHSDDDDDLSNTNHHTNNVKYSTLLQMTQSIVNADMIFYCFEILGNYLFNGKHHLGKHHSNTNGQLISSPIIPPTLPTDPYPLFVTWLIGSEQKLRGCIGTFTPMNLAHGLREYAITSATNDSRFSPISRDEYPLLSCAVSILTHFEPCSSYSDWDIGVHGIRIEFFNERGAKRSATYLPEVAHEQGWNHTQTLDSLLRKGGYKASITSDMRKSVQVTRYRSEKLTLHYNDYVQAKLNPSITTTFSYTTTTTTFRQQF